MMVLRIFFLLFLATYASAMYTAKDDVVELTPDNFASLVTDSDDAWFVEFYAPWCGHCKNLVPDYKKAATALVGFVKVGAVDADAHPSVGSPYDVRGFPTLKFFGANKDEPETYSGGRTAEGIVEYSMEKASEIALGRIGAKPKPKKAKEPEKEEEVDEGPNDSVVLTADNFDEEVLQSEDIWFVEFFAPWCGHCKNLAPEWKAAAKELVGKVKMGHVDATVESSLATKYGVSGYPTIKLFDAGEKSAEADGAADFEGGRTKSSIVDYAERLIEANRAPPEVKQLTSAAVFDETCSGSSLCVVAFLPHILDSGAAGRNQYLDTLKGLALKFKMKPFAYLWAEGYQHPELEQSMDVGGSGYPAMTVLNAKKGRFARMAAAFSEEGVSDFLKGIFSGRERTSKVAGGVLPSANTVEAWDGKDGELPQEEEFEWDDE